MSVQVSPGRMERAGSFGIGAHFEVLQSTDDPRLPVFTSA
jgi:hypothetical protein